MMRATQPHRVVRRVISFATSLIVVSLVVGLPAPAQDRPGPGGFSEKLKEIERLRTNPTGTGTAKDAPAGTNRNAEPKVVPRTSQAKVPSRPLIEIQPGTVALSKSKNPEQFWRNYYQKHDEEPDALREKVAILNSSRKFREVEAILKSYLRYRSNHAEPWMYSALAVSIKENSGDEAEMKTSLKYAADMAVKNRNPNDLVSVADQMFLLKEYDRVGGLLDQAADLIPHRAEPLVMSINLAAKTRDPNRMGTSIERLLSLGWPGIDETLRREAHKEAEKLAKSLTEDGRGEEAKTLLDRLPEAEARDLFVRLTWVGEADLDLAVDEPLGATARFNTPRTVFGGSIIKNGYLSHPEEVYVCPRGFDGEYTIHVESIFNNPEKPALQATLEVITHEGASNEHKETHTLKLGAKPPEPVKVTLNGGRRKVALPFLSPAAIAPPIVIDRAKRRVSSESTTVEKKNAPKPPATPKR